jgi:glycerophosphoryl diester phosphodiesterase
LLSFDYLVFYTGWRKIALTIVCAHRGASGYAPENTLAAFRRAGELGATWIEFDVHLSADGVPVILHDDILQRTTNLGQPVRVTQLTLKELKELDAGSWFGSAFKGETIPTLDEVLEEFGPSLGLNIEIKSKIGFEVDNGIEHKIAKALSRFNLRDKVVISSFDPSRLVTLHRHYPQLRLALLYSEPAGEDQPGFDPFKLAGSFGAVALHPPFKVVTPGLIQRAHELGLAVNTWTVNEVADIQRLIGLGVDMIISKHRLKALDN